MTFADLALAKHRADEAKAAGLKPTVRDVFANAFSPGTLAVALAAERESGDGHVEFRGGFACWVPGPARFYPGDRP